MAVDPYLFPSLLCRSTGHWSVTGKADHCAGFLNSLSAKRAETANLPPQFTIMLLGTKRCQNRKGANVMKSKLTSFLVNEDGAVTVDWVVLTAGLLILGIVVVGSIQAGATETSGALGTQLGAAQVPTITF